MHFLLERLKKLTPSAMLVCGFAALILFGAVLLMLPVSSASGENTPFLTSLFTSTSAVCVTGLVVVDTGSYWSSFGQIVILCLIQIGGLGFMSLTTIFLVWAGRKITLRSRIILSSSLNADSVSGMVRFVKYIILFTLSVEIIGAALLSFAFVPAYGFKTGVLRAIFHAVSAFCNAGFDNLGAGTSLMPFATNILVNLVICALIVIGGLGFAVMMDILSKRKFAYYETHTKLVLCVTGILISLGTLLFFIIEYNNPGTMQGVPLFGKVLESLFLSVTTRTAGFNTVDMGMLNGASKFLAILLMFIGGSPGSTAGGVKTTTFSMLFFVMLSTLRGRDDACVFGRTIKSSTIKKAITVILLGFIWIVLCVLILSASDRGIDLADLIFETVSAFGTVGLSTGITSSVSAVGRVVLIATMFVGRVGLTTAVYAIIQKGKEQVQSYRFPDGNISIG